MPVIKNRQDNYVKMRDQPIDGNNLEPAQQDAITVQRSRMVWEAPERSKRLPLAVMKSQKAWSCPHPPSWVGHCGDITNASWESSPSCGLQWVARPWLKLPWVLFQGTFHECRGQCDGVTPGQPRPHINKPKSSQNQSCGQSVGDVFSCSLSTTQTRENENAVVLKIT